MESSDKKVVAANDSSTGDYLITRANGKIITPDGFEADVKELEEELDDLKEDQLYAEFAAGVLAEELSDDEEFHPEGLKKEGGSRGESDHTSETEDNSGTEDEEHEDDVIVSPSGRVTIDDLPVSSKMKKEALKRFPLFWRMKSKMQSLDDSKSDDDSDFDPEKTQQLFKENNDESSSSESESEKEEADDHSEDMVALEAEKEKDLTDLIKAMDVGNENDDDEEKECFQNEPLGKAIAEVEEAYNSEEDPDFQEDQEIGDEEGETTDDNDEDEIAMEQ